MTQFAQPQRSDDAILAAERNGVGDGGDGGNLEEAGQRLLAGTHRIAALQHGLRQLERDGCAAQRLLGVAAAGLVGIQDGERVRDGVAGFQ